LRYYERAGLIEPVERSTSGRREYAASDLNWFAFIVRLRQTGMPITQMLQFAQLRAGGVATLEQRRQLLDEHRRNVEAAIAVQQDHLAALTDKITHYDQLIGTPRPSFRISTGLRGHLATRVVRSRGLGNLSQLRLRRL
jgi:DNA-binding transcriptional MerR regulator